MTDRQPAGGIAAQARDAGMRRATDHADDTHRGWNDRAYDFLVGFASTHAEFISEDVSDASRLAGFPQPPTLRAWGSVYRRAIRNDVIVQVGAGRSRLRHASICPRWGSLLCKAAGPGAGA
jgi:hypothetical protein